MIVYGVGDHLKDLLNWYPDMAKHIERVFDKDPGKVGKEAPGCGKIIEPLEDVTLLPAGTWVAIAAIKYYAEIARQIKELNPELRCIDIDEVCRLTQEGHAQLFAAEEVPVKSPAADGYMSRWMRKLRPSAEHSTTEHIQKPSVSREMVVACYRELLNRDPESEQVIEETIRNCDTEEQLRSDIMNSVEYKDKYARRADTLVYIPQLQSDFNSCSIGAVKGLTARLKQESAMAKARQCLMENWA